MSARLLTVTAWLAAGHALLAGLFWVLLQVPESNVAMLLVSALVGAVLLTVAGWVQGIGLAAWTPGCSFVAAVRRAVAAPVAMAAGLVLSLLVWLLTRAAAAAWTGHAGEVDAWLMLHVGWTRTAGLHAAVRWLILFVRYAVVASLLLTVVAFGVERGLAGLARVGAWLRAAVSPRRLALVALILYGFLWLPWRAVYWRPAWIAAGWQEPLFVGVKLGLLYLVANLGWAAMLYVVRDGAVEK
jgi:hypothetical protein